MSIKKSVKKGKVLQVVHLGQKILRTKAKPIKDVHDPEIQSLISDLIATCADFPGVGMAAPQVDESLRLFIMDMNAIPTKRDSSGARFTAIINPKILSKSKTKKKDWEGCMSIPGILGLVTRHTSIRVEYTDATGKTKKAIFTHFMARIFQHEYDHLEGIVFLDRTKGTDIMTEKEYRKMARAQNKK